MRRWLATSIATVLFLALPVLPLAAKKKAPPVGVIAASVGNDVVLIEPATGRAATIPAGPVAWLFPAPGGRLYAPDLVNGRTTVVDLRSSQVDEVMDGVTMPHFGQLADRYVVVGQRVLIVSYPERALIKAIDIDIENPWQVEVAARDRVLLVLERRHDGSGPTLLAAVMLDEGRPVYRRQLAGDIRRFSVSDEMGVIAMADAAAKAVRLVNPATGVPLADFMFDGQPLDLVFVDSGSGLLTLVSNGPGGGVLAECTFKKDKERGVRRKDRWQVQLDGLPARLVASPDSRHAAVVLTDGRVLIFDRGRQEIIASAQLAGSPRDVVWADPATPGPLLPEWSDQKPPELDLGDPERDFFKRPEPS